MYKISWRCSTLHIIPSKSPIKIQSFSELSQRQRLDAVAKELNITQLSDWYKTSLKDLQSKVGYSFIEKYNNSPYQLLSKAYPEYEWLPWQFSHTPRGFWTDINNQRKFMDWAGKELKIKEMSDWYKVSQRDFINVGGASLIKMYPMLSQILGVVYPEYEWLPWKFEKSSKNIWDMKNQRKFMDWVGKELGIKEMSDWYKLNVQHLKDLGGWTLLIDQYNGSPAQLLAAVYPEYDWLPWKFERTTNNYWNDLKNQRKFMDWAAKQLNITSVNDWYRVKHELSKMGGKGLLLKYNFSLPQLLANVFPEYNLNIPTKSVKKSQYFLKSCLKTLFPKEEVLEEYRHPDIVSTSGVPLELDFFYPQLNIAFEFQGIQHYKNVTIFHGFESLESNKKRDSLKVDACKAKGITLIEVPYWWDRKYESLQATVYSQKPDLFKEKPVGNPIPLIPPSQQTQSKSENSIARKSLMTATEWDESMDPTGWIMTEKYDGMRLYWNGTDFYSRQGNKVKVPESIKKGMPSVPLDGELWTQYGLYQNAVNICKSSDEEKWNKATFWVFDAPEISHKPFEERMEYLKEMKSQGALPSFVNIVETIKCEGKQHLKEFFDKIIAKGGEGVMLREPNSVYKAGRSSSLRKFKPFFDTEVKVVENNYPHGFNCVQINGKSLFVGLIADNYEEAKNVKKGSIVTVKHQGANTYGTLQYPQFYRERTDVKWEDLIKINP